MRNIHKIILVNFFGNSYDTNDKQFPIKYNWTFDGKYYFFLYERSNDFLKTPPFYQLKDLMIQKGFYNVLKARNENEVQ